MPIGAMCCKEKLNVFKLGDNASTHGGNPLACVAGLAVAKAFEEDSSLVNVQQRGEQLRTRAREIHKKYISIDSGCARLETNEWNRVVCRD